MGGPALGGLAGAVPSGIIPLMPGCASMAGCKTVTANDFVSALGAFCGDPLKLLLRWSACFCSFSGLS